MDITQLLSTITDILSQNSPALLYSGGKIFEGAAHKIGSDGIDLLKSLWSRLGPKMIDKPAALEALQKVADAPDNPDAKIALRQQLEEILSEDQALVTEICDIIQRSNIQSIVCVGDVGPCGKVTGVKIKMNDNNRDVESHVKAGKVEGELTGVSIN